MDGYLPSEDRLDVAQHIQNCDGCAAHVGQLAAAVAVLGARFRTRELESAVAAAEGQVVSDETRSQTFDQSQRVLAALARAADAEHADDLVQETWDHFLSAKPGEVPARDELVGYLMGRIGDHHQQEDVTAGAWADSLLSHHGHNAADLAESDLPPDPGGYGSLRELADLDALDTDADRAELLFPDLYSDGPGKEGWTSPPTAWPSVTRFLGPDAEVETSELYAVVDAALDELPQDVSDVVYLVDIEGHSLQTAGGLLGKETALLQRDLARGRRHVRARVNGYFADR
ncbi:RNA polymerase sigma factor [Kribbella sp. NPDC048928]|uniref:RNA polymerase sigma factor n=1 Tax=Kribbella sp. NPDC048928 TaxID=3364111 RepID=UPI00371550BC